MKKYEIKIEELKKEITEKEANALACALLYNHFIIITHGAEVGEVLRARKKGTAEAAGDLFGLPYISNSVNNEGAALWNTNTSAELAGLSGLKFLGVSINNAGEFVGLFQEHNEQGEEVGAVRCLYLDLLGEFIAENQKKAHEAERVAHLESVNQFRATAREILPKACAVLERYRGKRWGDTTRAKIWEELRALSVEGVTASATWGAYWLDLEIYKSRNGSGLAASFSWRFDQEANTPAEEITPSAKHWDKLANISIKDHREKMAGIIQAMEKRAAELAQLIDEYNNEARGKGYKKADNLSKWGVNLADLTSRELDA